MHNEVFNVGITTENYRVREIAEIVRSTRSRLVDHLRRRCGRGQALLPGRLLEDRRSGCRISGRNGRRRRAPGNSANATREFDLALEDFEGARYQRLAYLKSLLSNGYPGRFAALAAALARVAARPSGAPSNRPRLRPNRDGGPEEKGFAVTNERCPNCGGGAAYVFHHVPGVPVNSCLLFADRERAQGLPSGDIDLAYCPDCSFIFNAAWRPALTVYSDLYEETQGFSPTFNAFHHQLAEELVGRYDLSGKEIVEIGCGKGEFLTLLCELGGNGGIGYDPSFVPARRAEADRRNSRPSSGSSSPRRRSSRRPISCAAR